MLIFNFDNEKKSTYRKDDKFLKLNFFSYYYFLVTSAFMFSKIPQIFKKNLSQRVDD